MSWVVSDGKLHIVLQRALTAILVLAVLSGGICPALYEDVLPHEHVFIGGPPPADWEHHDHPNPLFLIFGRPDHTHPPPIQPVATTVVPSDGLSSGRVIPLYSGTTLIVVTVLILDAAVPLVDALRRTDTCARIVGTPESLRPVPLRPPPTPPPRPS